MPRRVGKDQGVEAALARGARLGAMGLLLSGNLGISTAFGMLLLLPLYVQKLGGDEASFGIASFASRYDTRLVIAVATSITALSLASFLLVGSSTLLYGLASGFVG